SFVGFVPADAPRLVILVMIDEPQKTYWGGEVAAPVFQKIALKTLRYLHIPSSLDQVFVLDRA
ncbi:MAG: penicillin-binding transpeptidase domain-containing protein, partial [Nitrospinae bacterium]|nr:penicillin-binding transpeptidase domain-containing protein [Nitrospinota bacterium]